MIGSEENAIFHSKCHELVHAFTITYEIAINHFGSDGNVFIPLGLALFVDFSPDDFSTYVSLSFLKRVISTFVWPLSVTSRSYWAFPAYLSVKFSAAIAKESEMKKTAKTTNTEIKAFSRNLFFCISYNQHSAI